MAASEKSTLEIEVITKGIGGNGGAVNWLKKLGEEAGKVEPKITRLTTNIGKLINSHNTAQGAAQKHMDAILGVGKSMTAIAASMTQMATAINAVTNQVNGLSNAANNSSRALEEKSRRGGVVVTTLRAMATAAAAYVGISFAVNIVKQADSWALLTAKLKLATGSMENAKAAQEDLFDLAQKTRSPLEMTTKLYTRMAEPLREIGKGHKDAMDMVEGLSMALKLGGSTAAESASAILQFSQSIRAGRLNGAEFNAISEGAPPILKAIREELKAMGQEVNLGQLKEMGSEGKLSVELIQKAMARALPQWRKDFEELPVTVDDALQRIKNAWFRAMGELGQETGMNKGLVEALAIIEKLIPVIRDEMVAAFVGVAKWIEANKSELGIIWDQVKSLVKDIWNIGSALGHAAGMALGLGNEFSAIGFTVFAIRLAIAGVQDGFVAIGGAIMKVGQILSAVLIGPLTLLVTTLLGVLTEHIGTLMRGIGKGMSAVGLDAGKVIQDSGKAMGDFSLKIQSAKGAGFQLSKHMGDAADNAFAYLASGDSAVQKVLKGEEAITATVKERHKFKEGPLGKGGANVDEKAAKKAAEEADKHREALDKINDKLKEQVEIQERLHKYGLDAPKVSASAKERIDLESDLAAATGIHKQRLEELLNVARQTEVMEALNDITKERLTTEANEKKAIEDKIKAINDEAIATEYKVKTFGMLKGAIDELEIAKLKDLAADYARQGGMDAEVAKIEALIGAKKRLGEANANLGILQGAEEAEKALDKFLNGDKLNQFGNDLKAAFGKGVEGISGMISAFDKLNKRQDAAEKARKNIEKLKGVDAKKYNSMMDKFTAQEAKDRIGAYGDMAGAAKQFFKEGTAGYAVMETAERAFRAVELAMAVQNNAAKLEGVWTFIAAKGQEVWAMLTGVQVDATTTQAHVALSGEKAAASTVAGTAKAFEQMGVYGFIGAAAILAFMASMGVNAGGAGGGRNIAKEQQDKQGTGTVLGDPTAKSESIGKSIELLSENSNVALEHSSGMLAALIRIRDSIGGMTKLIAASSGLRGTVEDGERFGVGTKSSWGGLKKKKIELVDAGIYIPEGQSVKELMESMAGRGYTTTKTTKKSFFSGSTKYNTYYDDLNKSLTEEIQLTMKSFVDTIGMASTALGQNGEAIKNKIKALEIDIGKISLKGLSTQEITEELEAVFGAAADEMAEFGFGRSLKDFQKAGEGYFETLVRAASGLEQATFMLDLLGIEAIQLKDILNKNGDIAAEIVRQSIVLKEHGSNVAGFINELVGSADDIVEAYSKLLDIRSNLQLTNLADDVTRNMIRGAGGLDNLQDSLNEFIEGMFSESEIRAIKVSKLNTEFTKFGVAMPKSTAEFRTLVESLKGTGAAGEELMGKILALSGAFIDLQDTISVGVDEARSNLQDAYDREADSLTTLKEKFEDFGQSLREFQESLLVGSLSPLTLGQKYATAKADYESTLAKARTGDEGAIAKFESVAQQFLQFSREYNASGTAYLADFNSVLTETEFLADFSENQVSIAEAQLEALDRQVEGLLDINESVLTVAQAIAELKAILELQGTAAGILPGDMQAHVDGSHASGLSYVPFDGYTAELHKGEAVLTASENRAYQTGQFGRKSDEALVSEIKALREEVKYLRADQDRQTGAIINSNFEANERNAQVVVAGVDDAISNSDRKVTVRPVLN